MRKFEEMKLKFHMKQGQIVIDINGQKIYYYPKKEWYSSRLFEDGRGFENLMIELKKLTSNKVNYQKFYEYCVSIKKRTG